LQVLSKLLLFTLLMFVIPFSTYFGSKCYIFEGEFALVDLNCRHTVLWPQFLMEWCDDVSTYGRGRKTHYNPAAI